MFLILGIVFVVGVWSLAVLSPVDMESMASYRYKEVEALAREEYEIAKDLNNPFN